MKRTVTIIYTLNDFDKMENMVADADELFGEEWAELEAIAEALSEIDMSPDDKVIQNIMNFAKSI